MRTIVANKSDLKKMGLKPCDIISIDMLGEYGFDDQLIKSMVDFEIFPDVIKLESGSTFNYFVAKDQIFGIVNRLLKNELAIYKAVAEKDKVVAEAEKYIEENKIKIEPEDLERIKTGEITMIELLESKEKHVEVESEDIKPKKAKKAKKQVESEL